VHLNLKKRCAEVHEVVDAVSPNSTTIQKGLQDSRLNIWAVQHDLLSKDVKRPTEVSGFKNVEPPMFSAGQTTFGRTTSANFMCDLVAVA